LRHGKTVALAAEDALPASAADSVPTVYFNNAYDRQLSVIEAFLIWALDRENRGGGPDLQLEQMTALQVQLHRVFESLRGGFVPLEAD
jgi:hypothetical protein